MVGVLMPVHGALCTGKIIEICLENLSFSQKLKKRVPNINISTILRISYIFFEKIAVFLTAFLSVLMVVYMLYHS